VDGVLDKVMKNMEFQARLAPHRYGTLLQEATKERLQHRGSGQLFPHRKEFSDLGVEPASLPLREITGGYGGAHCMTCVLSRQPKG